MLKTKVYGIEIVYNHYLPVKIDGCLTVETDHTSLVLMGSIVPNMM